MTVRWLLGLTLLSMGSWVLTGILLLQRDRALAQRTPAPDCPPTVSPANGESSGPWGQLEYSRVVLSPAPERAFEIDMSNPQVEWRFPKMSVAGLSELLSEIGLPEPLRVKLRDLAQLDPAIDGLVIRPSRELVLGLSAEERARLYAALYQFDENPDQQEAFRFRCASADQWLSYAPLAESTRRLVSPLIFRHGSFLFFADLRTVLPMIDSPEEQRRLLRVLRRDATYVVRLKVPPDADVEKLADYWGCGGREADVRSLLEGVAQSPDDKTIDITLLLPPFARQRLYTYELPYKGRRNSGPDCLWAALNFFNSQPDEALIEDAEAVRQFRTQYYPISRPRQLGDLVVLEDPETHMFVHVAVYLADDFWFTKNGFNPARPFMIMRLQEMRDFYPSLKPWAVSYYRRKGL